MAKRGRLPAPYEQNPNSGVFSLDAARENARKLRELHDDGKDARAHVKERRGAKDVSALVKLWEEDYKDKSKPSTQRNYASIIKVIILPALGTRTVKDLDYTTIKELHRKVSKEQPIGANRMITVLSRLMNIAEMEGWRKRGTNPCFRFPKSKKTACKIVLTAAQLGRLDAAMITIERPGKLDQVAADLFRFLALSGASQWRGSQAKVVGHQFCEEHDDRDGPQDRTQHGTEGIAVEPTSV